MSINGSMNFQEDGLYWIPVGGNNSEKRSGNCHVYWGVDSSSADVSSSIIVDLGRYDHADDFNIPNLQSVSPDIRSFLPSAQALILTHGHPDHINAVAEYAKAGIALPPIHATKETRVQLLNHLEEENVPQEVLSFNEPIISGDSLQIGNMNITPVSSAHHPGGISLFIKNKHASIFHTADIKMDQEVPLGQGTDVDVLQQIKNENGKIDLMVADNDNATVDDSQTRSTMLVMKTFESLMKGHADKKTITVPVGSSHLYSMASVIQAAGRVGRSVDIVADPYMKKQLSFLEQAGLDITAGQLKEPLRFSSQEEAYGRSGSVVLTSSHHCHPKSLFMKSIHDSTNGQSSLFSEKSLVIIPNTFDIFFPDNFKTVCDILHQKKARVFTSDGIHNSQGNPDIQTLFHMSWQELKQLHSIIEPTQTFPTHNIPETNDLFLKRAYDEGLNKEILASPKNGQIFHIHSQKKVALCGQLSLPWLGYTKEEKLISIDDGKAKSCRG